MKTTIKASKLTSFVKHTIFVLAAFFTSTVFADYYIGSAIPAAPRLVVDHPAVEWVMKRVQCNVSMCLQ